MGYSPARAKQIPTNPGGQECSTYFLKALDCDKDPFQGLARFNRVEVFQFCPAFDSPLK